MAKFASFVRSKTGLAFVSLFVALTVGILIGTLVSQEVSQAVTKIGGRQLSISGGDGQALVLDNKASLAEGFSKIVKLIGPAVVSINSQGIVTQRVAQPDGLRDFFGEPFNRFFDQQPRERKIMTGGSGVIVDSAGYILTNHHVVARGDKITVKLADGQTYQAEIVGEDRASDLAVLKVDAEGSLPYAKVGDSAQLGAGDWVVAIGSPFGFDQTVTVGIVSATERAVPTGIFGYYIQTDAAINRGNSGGPLVNMRGEVVGINTFINSTSGGFQGVGFAVPSTVFVNSYNQLVDKGKIERGWLGVSMNPLPLRDVMADYFGVSGSDSSGLRDGDGVLINQLIDEEGDPSETGPAYRAGVRPEDVIVSFADREIESIWDLRVAVANTPPGESVPLVVVRRGEVLHLDVELDERTIETNQQEEDKGVHLDEREARDRDKEIGLEVRTLTGNDRDHLNLDDERGVLILDVTAGSLGDNAGLRQGQVITHINDKPVNSVSDLQDAIQALPSGAGIVVRLIAFQGRDPRAPRGRLRKSIVYTSFTKP